MEKLAVSIIMPVYNSQEYIKDTIESIMQTKFQNFELLCLDDGSTDESGKILDELARIDKRIKVIHKENSGVCDTRNQGIKMARGEYVGFADNDDIVYTGFVEDNYYYASENDLDGLHFASEKNFIVDGKSIKKRMMNITQSGCYNRQTFFQNFDKTNCFIGCCWNHLYKRSVIIENNLSFPTDFKGGMEDLYFNIQFLKYAKRIGFNSDKVYYSWLQRDEHSTSRKFNPRILKSDYICAEEEYKLLMMEKDNISNLQMMFTGINLYLNSHLENLSLPTCNLSMKEKIIALKELRKSHIYQVPLDKKEKIKLRKSNIKAYIYYELFIHHHYRMLIIGKKIYNRLVMR